MKIAILGTRGIPNNYGGFEQCAEFLSVGLTERGHSVTVYSPHFHPYKEKTYKGVNIIKKLSPEYILGNSASNFIYDYLCFRDATRKDFDIILELGLITSSLSIIFCKHRGKIVATNLDGLEWKRKKWGKIVQLLTKTLEKYGVKNSDFLIADNIAIKDYIREEYGTEAKFIAYGAVSIKTPNSKYLDKYGLVKNSYFLTIARLEPENNLEMMFDAYLLSKSETPYFVIGNHTTPYGDYLKDKYRNKGIFFLGSIFRKIDLDNIRFYSKLYIHGHSVGGTNPSLLEAMAAKALIISHDNSFNRSVLNDYTLYFSSSKQLSKIFNSDFDKHRRKFVKGNIESLNILYKWPLIIDQYEAYFNKILLDSISQ